ncbi:Asp23/Gls24 family envelope stress response protein [Epidermidibacterium keratini]|uniref:Asp23/Gls24 family envelope stress response protein n=1 Tax=Epidermidibacterium keratini TaxID=1891644 RepID=A0A7L4YMU0_9ACTN|nr:Asp23/Gls24 family envelope stress response protein [Epidermidibacterium keratini]QHB99856.1 Asp23/Gls24 family envelope stress response protein [Epidermidibacterium keratini]
MSAPVATRPDGHLIGHNELGTISVNPSVVSKVASRASIDLPEVGAAQTRVLGLSVPGAGFMGGRDTDLSALPKASADVNGSVASIDLQVAVLWPHSVRAVSEKLRAQVIGEVQRICSVDVSDVQIDVVEFASTMARRPEPRVR